MSLPDFVGLPHCIMRGFLFNYQWKLTTVIDKAATTAAVACNFNIFDFNFIFLKSSFW
jgi:hypothetical protein